MSVTRQVLELAERELILIKAQHIQSPTSLRGGVM